MCPSLSITSMASSCLLVERLLSSTWILLMTHYRILTIGFSSQSVFSLSLNFLHVFQEFIWLKCKRKVSLT